MAPERVRRKLAAIMAVDVVGFSRLMELDEAGTLARLKTLRQTVFQPHVSQHSGRVVKLIGDGALCDFGSAVDAVQCAAEIQSTIAAQNAELQDGQEIKLRIGINLGEVIVDGNDIYGDGVNIAARLEALCEPGGVCISNAVHVQVHRRTKLHFADLGVRRLKNIEQATRIWRWLPLGPDTDPHDGRTQAEPLLPAGRSDTANRGRFAQVPEPGHHGFAMLERDGLVSCLAHLLEEADGGRGHVAALMGEAGAGKTTLLNAFLPQFASRCRAFIGACEDLSVPEPLAPLRDLARAARWSLSDAVDQNAGHLAVFEQAIGVFEGTDVPTLLVIEDLHWADDGTIDFVRFLGRRIRSKRILLVVTSRVEEAEGGTKLRRALGDVPPDDVVRIEVPPLSQSAVQALARVAGLDGSAVYEFTGGNAFFVTELIRSGRPEKPPSSVRDAVLVRADRLNAAARAIANVVAIFPRRVEEEVLQAFALPDTDDAIEDCLRIGLLVESDDGISFRHELARRAIESALTSSQRRRLNRRALEILQALDGTPVARLLHHAQEANATDAVVAIAPGAAREAARMGAHREAARHFETALTFADRYTEADRIALYEDASLELHIVGKQDRAIEVRKAAARLHRANRNQVGEGASMRALSRYFYSAGHIDDSTMYANKAVEVLKGVAGPELAMAYSTRSQLAMLAYDVENAIEYGWKAIRLAEELARPDILCHALNNIGHAMSWTDEAAGREYLERSLEMALQLQLPVEASRVFVNMAAVAITRFDLPRAKRTLEHAIGYAQEHQVDFLTTYLLGYLGRTLMLTGDWEKAYEVAVLSAEHPGSSGTARFGGLPPLVQYGLRTGTFGTAALLDELKLILEHGRQIIRSQAYASLMAEAAWLGQQDRDEVVALLSEIIEAAPNPLMVQDLLAWRRVLSPERFPVDTSRLVKPYQLLFRGDWSGAAQEWARIGAPYNRALALLEGDGDAYRSAMAILSSLGADAVVSHAEAQRCSGSIFR
jgi:class 3 adenylate cyclase/tetratricopeptide (TPR) repeat protein